MLIEAAWSYRFPAKISREQLLRQEQLPKPIRDTAWKAAYRELANQPEGSDLNRDEWLGLMLDREMPCAATSA